MIIYSINASPRKGWNDGQLLEQFKAGLLTKLPDAEIRDLFLYDFSYKGCRSCFSCKLMTQKEVRCWIHDEIYECLYNIRHSDGFAFASPIYFSDINGELKSFFERLLYPGPVAYEIPISAIYTMNANEEKMERAIRPALNTLKQALYLNFKTNVNEIFAFNTWQRDHNELYQPSTHARLEDKREYHKKHWPEDLQHAYEAGMAFADRVTGAAQLKSV